jgi:thioredoxin reductase
MIQHHEYIILGGGPAGIQLGYYFEKSERDYLVLERGDHVGSFFEVYPRHRQLISINKRHTGSDDPEFRMRHDWNSLLSDDYSLLFGQYEEHFFPHADNLVRYLRAFASKYRVRVAHGVHVTSIKRNNDDFILVDDAGREYSCRYLIVATGMSQPMIPEISGIELAECYSQVTVERAEFNNKRVLIIGKGNSAFETADHLMASAALIHLASPDSIKMAWKSHYVGDLRAVNNNFLDTYQLKSQNAILDAEVCGIKRVDNMLRVTFKYAHANGEVEEINYDRVIYCAGFRYDNSVFDPSAKPSLTTNCKYPSITWEFESVNQPRLYFAGTITHSLDYGKATSGFIHGFRYNVRALATMLGAKYHDQPWSAECLSVKPTVLTQAALNQVNRSAGLWQQPGFIADIIGIDSVHARYFREMPIGYARAFADEHFDDYYRASCKTPRAVKST